MSEPTKPKYVQKDNSGSLFTNTYKNNDDSAPDFRGNGAVVCPCCNKSFTIGISGWIKPGKDGRSDWTSFRFKPSAVGGAVAGAAKPSGWRPGQPQQAAAPARPQSPPAAQRQAYTPPQRQPPPPPPQQESGVPPEDQGVMDEDDVPF